MKKAIAVIISALATVLVANAELNEVRGITVEFKHSNEVGDRWGFHIHNTNPFEVSVDIERWDSYDSENGKHAYEARVVDTRSIQLKPNETYIWKISVLSYLRYKAYAKSSQ